MIVIYKGEDTEFANLRQISFTLQADGISLVGFTGRFFFMGVDKCIETEKIQAKAFTVVYTTDETKEFPLGMNYGTFHLYDADGQHATTAKVQVDVRLNPNVCGISTANQIKVDANNVFVNYNQCANKPVLNGKVIEGSHDSSYYGIISDAAIETEKQRAMAAEAALGQSIAAETSRATSAEATLTASVNNKVDKVSGKGLSTNDFTNADKGKLDGVASGAQVNVIETVKVNGSALGVTSKAVDVRLKTINNTPITGDGNIQINPVPSDYDTVRTNAETGATHAAIASGNPHGVTYQNIGGTKPSYSKAEVGLGNVDNTSDLNKPISTATQVALDGKQATIDDLSTIRSNAAAGLSASTTISTYGNIVTHNTSEFDASGAASAVQANLNTHTGNSEIHVTADQKTAWSGKQDAITDLEDIRSNATAGAGAATTISGYGDIVTHDADEFATAEQGAKADSALQQANILDVVTSSSTTDALSANKGRELNARIDSITARGRYLSLWNCVTGLPETNPTTSPYLYKTGDYFVVGTIATVEGVSNYRPSGSQYVIGTASTTVESGTVSVGDTYCYDGTVWTLMKDSVTVSFAALSGSPNDNTALKTALDAKISIPPDGSTSQFLQKTASGVQWANALTDASQFDAAGAAAGVQENLTTHVNNTTIHVTSDEKQNITDNTSARHTHTNKDVLDATTASYTTDEKSKLAGLAAQVQADWTETNVDSKAFIQHKPIIYGDSYSDYFTQDSSAYLYKNGCNHLYAGDDCHNIYAYLNDFNLTDVGARYRIMLESSSSNWGGTITLSENNIQRWHKSTDGNMWSWGSSCNLYWSSSAVQYIEIINLGQGVAEIIIN